MGLAPITDPVLDIATHAPPKRSPRKSKPTSSSVLAGAQSSTSSSSECANKAVLDHGQTSKLRNQGKEQLDAKMTMSKQDLKGHVVDKTDSASGVDTEVWKPGKRP